MTAVHDTCAFEAVPRSFVRENPTKTRTAQGDIGDSQKVAFQKRVDLEICRLRRFAFRSAQTEKPAPERSLGGHINDCMDLHDHMRIS